MSYRVDRSRLAEHQLAALPSAVRERIRPHVLALAEEPRPRGSRKIGPGDRRRLRVGDYRVIYDVDDRSQTVTVRVGHRKDIYR